MVNMGSLVKLCRSDMAACGHPGGIKGELECRNTCSMVSLQFCGKHHAMHMFTARC